MYSLILKKLYNMSHMPDPIKLSHNSILIEQATSIILVFLFVY